MRRDIYNLSQIQNWLGRVMAKVFRDVSGCIGIPLWLPVFTNRTTLASRCLKVVPLAPWGRTGRIALPSWKRRQGWLGCRNRRRLSKCYPSLVGKPWQTMTSHGKPSKNHQKSLKNTSKQSGKRRWGCFTWLLLKNMSLQLGVSEIGLYGLPPKYQNCNS